MTGFLKISLALFLLALTGCTYKETERETGYKGKARTNPWLAAQKFTTRYGHTVISPITWQAPTAEDGTWIVPTSILTNLSFSRRMERWISEGGHLILLVDYTETGRDDWMRLTAEPIHPPALTSLLKEIGIVLEANHQVTASEIQFREKSYKIAAESTCAVSSGKEKPGVFTTVSHGGGRLSVLTDARLFRNRWISDQDHAALLHDLIDSSPAPGRVGFMRGSELSIWELLSAHLWPVLIGLGVWISLWIWKNFSRFGPIEPTTTAPVLRGYGQHLEALGDFHWRNDRATGLLAPLRQEIIEKGQRRSARSGQRDDDFFQFLADRAGISRERAFRALAETAPADSPILTRTTADLQRMLRVLH